MIYFAYNQCNKVILNIIGKKIAPNQNKAQQSATRVHTYL